MTAGSVLLLLLSGRSAAVSLLPGARSVIRRAGARPTVRGRVWLPALAPAGVPPSAAVALKPIARAIPRRRGRASVAQSLMPIPSMGLVPSWRIARRPDGRKSRIVGFAHGTRWIPALPLAPAATVYLVYSNTGAGDPIDYGSPIASVSTLSYLTGALTYPGTWSFGVRALDVGSGLEEQNVDAAVTIILDAGGNDITNQPPPPLGLRAFAMAGGAIRVEWTSPSTSLAKTPIGFHVYLGSSGTSSLAAGPMEAGGGFYANPVETVLYATMYANSFVANLAGLTDGMSYTIGVRAYNATAEERNTNTVILTADATGPAAVDSLTAIATV